MTNKNLTPAEKVRLVNEANSHIQSLVSGLKDSIASHSQKIEDLKNNIPQLEELDLFSLDPDSVELEILIAKIKLYTELIDEAEVLIDSPYFARVDVIWKESGKHETLYFGKHQYKDHNIFSWVAPIATLRFAEMGDAEYLRPDGKARKASIGRKDSYLITDSQVVFMTYSDTKTERQVVYQKHFEERKEFLLPEIVAELDKLQDQIIRSDPRGYFLISGPAGSGKTTLALHRIAYLVLTPEFKDFFKPERVIVFVSNVSDINYFGKLLPELGINGVQVTTFSEWATMIANSRFRAKLPQRFKQQDEAAALEFARVNSPIPALPPRLILDEFRRLKQQIIMPIRVREGSQKDVYPELHKLYLTGIEELPLSMASSFQKYLQFQKQHKFLDEVDLTILLMSLENPVQSFSHMVIDEVQNWIPEQLQIITSFAHYGYKSVTFIGDIRQKTKAFTIKDWGDISEEFASAAPRKAELLKVYRNTKQILNYLQSKGYDIDASGTQKEGPEVMVRQAHHDNSDLVDHVDQIVQETIAKHGKVQIAIIAKYADRLSRFDHYNYAEDDQKHVRALTAEAAQGLEFHTVIIINAEDFELTPAELQKFIDPYSAFEYAEQARHLFYVATTRAQFALHVLN